MENKTERKLTPKEIKHMLAKMNSAGSGEFIPLEAITEKVKNKKELTDKESQLYMRYVLKYSEDQINKILSTTKYKDVNVIVD